MFKVTITSDELFSGILKVYDTIMEGTKDIEIVLTLLNGCDLNLVGSFAAICVDFESTYGAKFKITIEKESDMK